MRPFAAAVCTLVLALSTHAGVTYRLDSSTRSGGEVRVAGDVKIEGKSMRMQLSSGDGMIFKKGAIVTSADGGTTLNIHDPATKTFYTLSLEDVIATTSGAIKQLADFTVTNPKVSARPAGDGGKVEGYPTKKSITESSYDMSISMAGRKTKMTISSVTESWTTDQLPEEFISFLQQKMIRTGFDEVDRLLAKNAAKMKGFPLKQVMTVKVTTNGRTVETTHVTTVTQIRKRTVAKSELAAPAGYKKVPNPIEMMVR